MTSRHETTPVRNVYGAVETNGLVQPHEYRKIERDRTVYWTEKGLKITRLRLLSDQGFPYWDVSYCHGVLPDGTEVRVALPFYQLAKRTWKSDIVKMARHDGLYAKGTGIFEAVSALQ